MNYSYNGIGQYAATFALKEGDTVEVGNVVKITASETVGVCADADVFAGVAISERGGCVAVQLGGIACVEYSGTAPTVGYAKLAADGNGGIKVAGTKEYLVLSVDNGIVSFVL